MKKGNFEIVQLLCQKENIDVNMKTINSYPGFDDIREGITPFHFAIGNEDSKIIEILASNPKVVINLKSTIEQWCHG